MYSKDMGITRLPPRDPRRPPVRSPRVSVPPNYRGHAIVDGEERPLGALSQPTEDTPPLPAADTPVPRFEGLPRVSQLGERSRPRPGGYPPEPPLPREEPPSSLPPESLPAVTPPPPPPAPTAPRASATPRGLLSPGLEELLLLGLILFLLREGGDCTDRGDLDETVILLGLLLLLG